MTPEQFTYWLQGFVELTPDIAAPSPAQWDGIKNHLDLVFAPSPITHPDLREGHVLPAAPFRRPRIDTETIC